MKKTIISILAFLSSLLLIVALLFTALQICMNDENWFSREYEKLGTSDEIGISNADITSALMRLVDYMEGREASIHLTVTENSQTVSMYNAREEMHMVDVQILYQAWRSVRNFGFAFALVVFAAIAYIKKKEALGIISRAIIRASVVFVALLLALVLWVLIDFNSFWLNFHYLFFNNDLWLLSYSTDRMIRICPQELFFDIIVRFGIMFIIAFLVLVVAAVFVLVRKRKQTRAEGSA